MSNFSVLNTSDGVYPAITSSSSSSTVANALAVLITLLSVLTVSLNFILILVIFRTPFLHTKTNAMLVSVVVCEFLIGLIVLPSVAFMWYRPTMVFPQHLCEFYAFMTSLTASSKSFGMLSLSIDRCLAVSHPLQYSSYITKTTTALSVAFVWFVSFIFACFPLWNVGKYVFIPAYRRCLHDFYNYMSFTVFKEVTCSVVPSVAITLTLFVILFEARSHHRVITIAQLSVAMYTGPAAFPQLNRYTRSTFKAMRTYIIITVIYLVTYLPLSLFTIMVAGNNTRHSHTTFTVLSFLKYLCGVVTPLVITTLSKKFKDGVKLVFVRVNRVRPLEKEAFTISTGLHSILEASMVVQFVPRKDSTKLTKDEPKPGPSGTNVKFATTRKFSMVPEVRSSTSSEHVVLSGTSRTVAYGKLRKTLSSPKPFRCQIFRKKVTPMSPNL